jgi:manganese/zinc/iron transport system substrate-binding protein
MRRAIDQKTSIYRAPVLFLLASALSLAGCQTAASQATGDLSGRRIRVVATTGMIADAAGVVGGDRAQVVALMGPGVDPHLYKASEGDVAALSGADIIFYNGLHLEAAMANVLQEMQGRTRSVAVTDGIDRDRLLTPPEFEGNFDPHVWFDVGLWMEAVRNIQQAYTAIDPVNADVYRANAEAYLAELAELHEYVHQQAGRVPAERRVLITAHDAFNYFGRAYGFEVQGISTATEASTADVKGLIDFIVERGVPAIFIESSVPQRNIEALQAGVRARGFDVTIGGQLYSDALGDPGTSAGSYLGMVRSNIDTIVRALVGEG